MLRAIDMGCFILDKYYHLSDNAPVYAAALLLDLQSALHTSSKTGLSPGTSQLLQVLI